MPIYKVQKFIYRHIAQSRRANRVLDGFGGAMRLLRIPYATGLTRNKAIFLVSENPQKVKEAEEKLLKYDRRRSRWTMNEMGRNYFREIDFPPSPPQPAEEDQIKTSTRFGFRFTRKKKTGSRSLIGISQIYPLMRRTSEERGNGVQVHKIFPSCDESIFADLRFRQVKEKVILTDAKPVTPMELEKICGLYDAAIRCLAQAIKSKEKNPRISSILEKNIIRACQYLQIIQMEASEAYFKERGFDLVFENISADSVIYFWLAEYYKQEFFSAWTSSSFDYDRLIDLAKKFYHYLFAYHASRDQASASQLAELEQKYKRIVTPREPFYADLLLKDGTRELSDATRLGTVLKGLIHESLSSFTAISKSDIDKLPTTPEKLKAFFRTSNRRARKAESKAERGRELIKCFWEEISDTKYIRPAAFAAATVIFGAVNWAIRWGLSKGYIKDKKEKRNLYLNEQVMKSGKIAPAHTKAGDFYFYFRVHSTRDFFASEEIRLDLKTVEKLHAQIPDLIFAPEMMLKYQPGRKKYEKKGCKDHMQDLGLMSISEDSSKFMIKQKIPLLLLDARIPASLDTDALDQRPEPLTARDVAFYAPPFIWGTALARLFSNNHSDKSVFTRRGFLGILGFGAAETVLNTVHYRWNWGPEKWQEPFTIQFRNALFAYKLLRWSRMYQEQHGKKPSLLITFGAAHGDIIKNIEKGEAYNLKIIRRLGKTYGYTRSMLGDQIHHGFLYTPNSATASPGHEIVFPKLLAAIPR